MSRFLFLPLVFVLASALPASANDASRAVCAVKSTLGNARVSIDLHREYRYLVGSENFKLPGGLTGNSIEIVTFEGKGGQVAQNTYEVAGVKLTGAALNATISTGSFSYSVDCELE